METSVILGCSHLNQSAVCSQRKGITPYCSQKHKITRCLRLEVSSGGNLIQPHVQAGPPKAGLQDAVKVSYEDLQGRRLHNFSGQPVPVIWHLHVKKCFLILRELLVFRFVPIVFCPVAEHS